MSNEIYKNSVIMNIKQPLNLLVKSLDESQKIGQLIESLTGVIPNDDIEERKEYRDFVDEKYS